MAPTATTTTRRAGCAASVAMPSLTAHVVGKAFAQHYYRILQRSPEEAYKFYHDDSCLARSSGDGDGTNCVTTLPAIHEKITATCAGLAGVEVLTVDSHHSHGRGVTVLVTGTFTFAGDDDAAASPRAFVQSFFLAPQCATSYYVRNDTHRFVGSGTDAATASASSSPAMAAAADEKKGRKNPGYGKPSVAVSCELIEVEEPGKGEEEEDRVHGDKPVERRGDREGEEEVEDAAGSNRFGHMLGKLRGLLLPPGISVSGDQAEVTPAAVPVKNEPQAVPVKDDEPEENGFLVIDG